MLRIFARLPSHLNTGGVGNEKSRTIAAGRTALILGVDCCVSEFAAGTLPHANAKACNQSAAKTIHIQAVSMGKHRSKRTDDGWPRPSSSCTHAQRSPRRSVCGEQHARTSRRIETGLEKRQNGRRWCGLYTRLGHNGIQRGSMADIRRVHGRQGETHQFPIQFAASPPPRLANSRLDATPANGGAFRLGTGILVRERRFQSSSDSIPSSHVA